MTLLLERWRTEEVRDDLMDVLNADEWPIPGRQGSWQKG